MIRSAYEHTVDVKDLYEAIARGEDILQHMPDHLAEQLGKSNKVAIAEIADRDSIAAVVKIAREGKVGEVLPVADAVPPLYGDLNKAFDEVFWLKQKVAGYDCRVYDLIFLEASDLYNTLVARYKNYIIKRYGFYTPCLTCHLYFHTARVPIVKALGGTKIIGGERKSHDGRIKASQIPVAVEYYTKAVRALGGELILPLWEVENTKDIIKMTYADNPHLSCMFKETFGNLSETIAKDELVVKKFFQEFAVPLDLRLINAMTSKENVDLIKVADEFVKELQGESK